MKMKVGKYFITSDEYQFIVQEKKIIKDGKNTKKENIGSEKLVNIGYFTTLEGIMQFLAMREIRMNDDLLDAQKEIAKLRAEIRKLSDLITMKCEG